MVLLPWILLFCSQPDPGVAATPIPAPAAVTPARPPQPLQAAEEGVIVNYWQHVKELYAAHGENPTRYTPVEKTTFPPPRTFTVESFSHLRAKDLLRAAEEGVIEARADAGRDPDLVDRQVAENVRMALEYYPNLARSEDDVLRLFRVMESGGADPVFRRYLIERVVPGLAPISVFSCYLQEQAMRLPKELKQILSQTVEGENHPPEIRAISLEVLYRVYAEEVRRILQRDTRLVEEVKAAKESLDIVYYTAHPDLRIAPDLKKVIEYLMRDADQLAALLTRKLSVARPMDPALRATMLRVLRGMRETFPLAPNADLDALLKAEAAAS